VTAGNWKMKYLLGDHEIHRADLRKFRLLFNFILDRRRRGRGAGSETKQREDRTS
jgi:hypothetical protein